MLLDCMQRIEVKPGDIVVQQVSLITLSEVCTDDAVYLDAAERDLSFSC